VSQFAEQFRVSSNQDAKGILKFLSLRGVVLYREEEDDVFLDPQWVTRDIVGDIADGKVKSNEPFITAAELKNHWHLLLPEIREQIPKILMSLKLCCQLSNDQFIIPLLAPEWDIDRDGSFAAAGNLRSYEIYLRVLGTLRGLNPGVFAFLQFHWWQLQPDEERQCIRKDRTRILFGRDVCWVQADPGQSRIRFHVTPGGEWLASALIETMRCVLGMRFEGLELWVLNGSQTVQNVCESWKTCEFIVNKDQLLDAFSLLPLPHGGIEIRSSAFLDSSWMMELYCAFWKKGILLVAGESRNWNSREENDFLDITGSMVRFRTLSMHCRSAKDLEVAAVQIATSLWPAAWKRELGDLGELDLLNLKTMLMIAAVEGVQAIGQAVVQLLRDNELTDVANALLATLRDETNRDKVESIMSLLICARPSTTIGEFALLLGHCGQIDLKREFLNRFADSSDE
jgi:hypothetical protein